MNEEKEEEIKQPSPPQPQIPPTVDTSSLLGMLKNPYVMTILKKNPEEVQSLLSSLGSTSEMMAMAYIQGNHPDLYDALQGIETPDDEKEEPHGVLELTNEEYENIMKEAYDTANARDLTDSEVTKWILQTHNAEIPPAKVRQAFAKIEKDNGEEPEEEEPEDTRPPYSQPQSPREEQNQNTRIIQDLLRRKKESDLKAKEAEEAQQKAEEHLKLIMAISQKQETTPPQPPPEKKGLIRKFAGWIY